MSTTAAAPAETEAAPKKRKLSKKLIIILAAALVVVLAGGGAAVYVIKQRAAAAAAAAAEAEGEDGEGGKAAAADAHAKEEPKHKDAKHGPPTFVPLDPFVVNLADRDTDRYLQVSVTFEIEDAHEAEVIRGYMPAIRNAILLVLAHKTSDQLLDTEGKEKLAEEIRSGSARAMGLNVGEAAAPEAHAEAASSAASAGGKKKKKKVEYDTNPITHVHYANFIIQ